MGQACGIACQEELSIKKNNGTSDGILVQKIHTYNMLYIKIFSYRKYNKDNEKWKFFKEVKQIFSQSKKYQKE